MTSVFLPYDFILYSLGINCNELTVLNISDKPILFYGESMNFRIYNLIKLFKDEGRPIYWLTTKYKKKIHSDLTNNQIFTRNKYHSKRILINSNLDIMFYFASDARFCSNGIENFKGTKFFDNYDNYLLYYGYNCEHKFSKELLIAERKCFENANYVIARNIEVNEVLRRYELKDKKKVFIPDSCIEERFKSVKPIIVEEIINLVYCGGLFGHKEQNFTHGFDDFTLLYENIERNNINVHLYPNPYQSSVHYTSLLDMAKHNKNLFIHNSIANELLIEEISKYNFGIIPHYKIENTSINAEKLKYATSNKFLNFLEAGLPIIVTDEMEFMAWIVKRYKIGIVINKSDFSILRSIILSYDYSRLCDNVDSVRKKFVFNDKYNKLKKIIC